MRIGIVGRLQEVLLPLIYPEVIFVHNSAWLLQLRPQLEGLHIWRRFGWKIIFIILGPTFRYSEDSKVCSHYWFSTRWIFSVTSALYFFIRFSRENSSAVERFCLWKSLIMFFCAGIVIIRNWPRTVTSFDIFSLFRLMVVITSGLISSFKVPI